MVPPLGASLAYRLWFRTVRPPESSDAFDVLRRARYREVRVDGGRMATYEWGRGPTVLLVHGWGADASRMTAFVDPLVQRGRRVVAVDLPGHGRSAGWRTDIFRVRDALLAIDVPFGPDAAVVAHSLGSLAYLTSARAGLEVGAGVLVSPAIQLADLTGTFERRLGLSPYTMRRLARRLSAFLGDRFYPSLLESGPGRALVIHDRDDAEIPWESGQATARALPDAGFITTTGLGHNRILRDPAVVEEAVRFIA
jgi:pimeloyl-ACP methyl ester carboxylesterase